MPSLESVILAPFPSGHSDRFLDDAYLINIARRGVVDQLAFVAVLEAETFVGATFDVSKRGRSQSSHLVENE